MSPEWVRGYSSTAWLFMSKEQVSEPATAADDEYAAVPDPDAVIEFGDDVEEGFVGLVEHTLATSDFVRTHRVSMTAQGSETTLLVSEVEPDA